MAFVPNRPFARAWGGASGKRVRRSSGELLRRRFSRWAEKVGRRRFDGDGIGGEAMRAALAENRGGEKDDDAGTVIFQNFHRDPFGQLPACLLVASSHAGMWRQPAGNFTAAARRRAELCSACSWPRCMLLLLPSMVTSKCTDKLSLVEQTLSEPNTKSPTTND